MSVLETTIAGQPQALGELEGIDVSAAVDRLRSRERWSLVGTGTSQHAAELGAWALRRAGLDARAWGAAEFVRFGPSLGHTDAAIVLSHTGETAFAQSALATARAGGAATLAITGRGVGWDDALEVAERETSETYTASYLAALYVLGAIACELGSPGFTRSDLEQVPDHVGRALEAPLDEIDPGTRLTVVSGCGPFAVTAREGALKLREAARLVTQGFDAEYLLHGSAVPLGSDDALVLVQPEADPDGLAAALGDAASSASVNVVRAETDAGVDPYIQQFALTAKLQAAAARLAAARGFDPDVVIEGPWADEDLWLRGAP